MADSNRVAPSSRVRRSCHFMAITCHKWQLDATTLQSADLAGQEFTLLSAGPLFRFTPAVSFLVACRTKGEADELWKVLEKRGSALVELGRDPFSERYGWLQDRDGLSWQIMFMGGRPVRQKITPHPQFV